MDTQQPLPASSDMPYLLYNTGKIHQFRLRRCPNYTTLLPAEIVAQIKKDGESPTGTNYCWLLAPSIASAPAIPERYLFSSDHYSAETTDGVLAQMNTLFSKPYITSLKGGVKARLVENGAILTSQEQADAPILVENLYTAFDLIRIHPPREGVAVYDPERGEAANCAVINGVLKQRGPLLLCRPSGVSFHMECVVGIALLQDEVKKSTHGAFIVVSTQPSATNPETGEYYDARLQARLFSDLNIYFRHNQVRMWAFAAKPERVATFAEHDRLPLIHSEVLTALNEDFRYSPTFGWKLLA